MTVKRDAKLKEAAHRPAAPRAAGKAPKAKAGAPLPMALGGAKQRLLEYGYDEGRAIFWLMKEIMHIILILKQLAWPHLCHLQSIHKRIKV